MQLIENQQEFDKLLIELLQEKLIFIDTEFYRRKTYYAKLSLVQIATNHKKIIIDVLSGINISSLKDLLLNEQICKVFHAADQDLLIFYHIFGKLPKNVFDTQIASSVIGLGDAISYSNLCKTALNLNIDKTMQNTNWLHRPLTENLLEYAIKDVEYLIPLYRDLFKEIDSRNLWETYKARSAKLLDINSYKINPEKLINRLCITGKPKRFKENFYHFVMLREECAQAIDLPRAYCASNEDLIKICEQLPVTDRALLELNINRLPIARKNFKLKLFELCVGMREQ